MLSAGSVEATLRTGIKYLATGLSLPLPERFGDAPKVIAMLIGDGFPEPSNLSNNRVFNHPSLRVPQANRFADTQIHATQRLLQLLLSFPHC